MPFAFTNDASLAKQAILSKQERQFYTCGRIEDALAHLEENPNDVCVARHDEKKILLGGPVPEGTLLDVTDMDFSHCSDSFDVGEMTRLVREWFKADFDKDVTVGILESGESEVLGGNSKLISLSRKTPGLLDMAATENGRLIGQYNAQGSLGHSGDMNSTIGGVTCLHHEVPLKPSTSRPRLYFLVGFSSLPLKSWRDSRVFWILYDTDVESCWLVPHNLSDESVGDDGSATMALASKSNKDGTVTVMHLADPVYASLKAASPLVHNTAHKDYIQLCIERATEVDWSDRAVLAGGDDKSNAKAKDAKGHATAKGKRGDASPDKVNVDGSVAIFDGCGDKFWDNFPVKLITGTGDSLSTMRGPLKVLARGCCANSRVVVVDGKRTFATSDVNLVSSQLSGVIVVKTEDPDIHKLNQVRWNAARGTKTSVIAASPDGFKHMCGPIPPFVQIEDHPTPTPGTLIPEEDMMKLVKFALSSSGDEYYGPLYQNIPTHEEAQNAIVGFIDATKLKDFTVITDETVTGTDDDDPFTDDDFRRLMEVINVLSVSSADSIQRNQLAIRIIKFLRGSASRAANKTIANDENLRKSSSDLDFLQGWTGDNIEWAVQHKDTLEVLLKESSVKISPQEGVIDLALQTRLDEAVEKARKTLKTYTLTKKKSIHNSFKKTFNRVFYPALEALMRSIGDNPKYMKFFHEIKLPNMSGVIIRATQSTNKKSLPPNPEDVMKLFHRLGATGFTSFTVEFFQAWKSKVINELCVVDKPGCGFNSPESFVPSSHRIDDGPADPAAAYKTDIRNRFVLPIFARLPKTALADDDEDDEDSEEDGEFLGQLPIAPEADELAENLLLRAEFTLRDPEQGTKHPLWLYCDWLFDRIKTVHGVVEKEAAPLAMRSLGFSILQLMKSNPSPDRKTMEIVSSIIHAISFMSARGDPQPHGIIDTFFNMGSTYVPQTKEMEKNPWQIEVVNILSQAVDYVRPIMSWEEYTQIRCNFQRGAANVVKRQVVQKLLDHMQEEAKKNAQPHNEYVSHVNSVFYPAYRDVVETVRMLIDADPASFELTDDLVQRINSLYHTVAVEWSKNMRRCRIGPVRQMVDALKKFSEQGGKAMSYLVSRKEYLELLYDQVYHIKYESCDHALVEETCKIIRAKSRNPAHEKHSAWLARVDRAIDDVAGYDAKMSGFAHGNQYKPLPTDLMKKILQSLKESPASASAVSFADIKLLLSHIRIDVEKRADLYMKSGEDPSGKKTVFEQLRGQWWMCPEFQTEPKGDASPKDQAVVPKVPLISMGHPASSDILAVLGDTYHRFELARLFSGDLKSMRGFIRENYKFHVGWFENTILAAGLPKGHDPEHKRLAVYAVVQRLVCELAEDGSDRGDRARDRVYGEVVDPLAGNPCGSNPSAALLHSDETAITIQDT